MDSVVNLARLSMGVWAATWLGCESEVRQMALSRCDRMDVGMCSRVLFSFCFFPLPPLDRPSPSSSPCMHEQLSSCMCGADRCFRGGDQPARGWINHFFPHWVGFLSGFHGTVLSWNFVWLIVIVIMTSCWDWQKG